MYFKDIKGQAQALNILKSYLGQGHLSGGYIFSGPQGVGKMLAAKVCAQRLNCAESASVEPCGNCASCLKIDKLAHPDLHIIDHGAAQVRIEDVRALQKQISFRPYEGRSQVFIINNAHRLNADASGALLKIREEPPEHSLIILISDKMRLLFDTVISRCKVIRFSGLPRKELELILKQDYASSAEAAHFLAYYSEGSLGEALKLKDTDIIQRKNNLADSFVFSLRPPPALSAAQSSEELRFLLNTLASFFRDIYLIKTGAGADEVINFDRRQDLLKAEPRFSYSQLDDIFSCLTRSADYLESNINSKLLLYNLGAQLWKN